MAIVQDVLIQQLYLLDIYHLLVIKKKSKKYNREAHKKAEIGLLFSRHLQPNLEKKIYL